VIELRNKKLYTEEEWEQLSDVQKNEHMEFVTKEMRKQSMDNNEDQSEWANSTTPLIGSTSSEKDKKDLRKEQNAKQNLKRDRESDINLFRSLFDVDLHSSDHLKDTLYLNTRKISKNMRHENPSLSYDEVKLAVMAQVPEEQYLKCACCGYTGHTVKFCHVVDKNGNNMSKEALSILNKVLADRRMHASRTRDGFLSRMQAGQYEKFKSEVDKLRDNRPKSVDKGGGGDGGDPSNKPPGDSGNGSGDNGNSRPNSDGGNLGNNNRNNNNRNNGGGRGFNPKNRDYKDLTNQKSIGVEEKELDIVSEKVIENTQEICDVEIIRTKVQFDQNPPEIRIIEELSDEETVVELLDSPKSVAESDCVEEIAVTVETVEESESESEHYATEQQVRQITALRNTPSRMEPLEIRERVPGGTGRVPDGCQSGTTGRPAGTTGRPSDTPSIPIRSFEIWMST